MAIKYNNDLWLLSFWITQFHLYIEQMAHHASQTDLNTGKDIGINHILIFGWLFTGLRYPEADNP